MVSHEQLKAWVYQRLDVGKLKKTDFLIVFLVIEAALLIGGSALPGFGSTWEQYRWPLGAYMLITIPFLSYGAEGERLKSRDFLPASRWIIIGFGAGWAATLLFVSGTGITLPVVQQDRAMMLLIWFGIVATNEEIVFRGVLPERVGDFTATLLFALFHFAAYDANLLSMGWIFVFGALLLYLYKRSGKKLGFVIGLHWAYNGVMSGVLIANFA